MRGTIEKITLLTYMLEAMSDEGMRQHIQEKVTHCGGKKVKILWEIFFETDICDTKGLKNKIYEYGSYLKENDHFGRELFVIMAAFVG